MSAAESSKSKDTLTISRITRPMLLRPIALIKNWKRYGLLLAAALVAGILQVDVKLACQLFAGASRYPVAVAAAVLGALIFGVTATYASATDRYLVRAQILPAAIVLFVSVVAASCAGVWLRLLVAPPDNCVPISIHQAFDPLASAVALSIVALTSSVLTGAYNLAFTRSIDYSAIRTDLADVLTTIQQRRTEYDTIRVAGGAKMEDDFGVPEIGEKLEALRDSLQKMSGRDLNEVVSILTTAVVQLATFAKSATEKGTPAQLLQLSGSEDGIGLIPRDTADEVKSAYATLAFVTPTVVSD